MNLVGGEIGGRLVTDGEAIARISVGQGPDAGIEAAMRRVIFADESREFCVGWRDLVFDRAIDLFAQLLSVCLRNGIRKLAQWIGERALVEGIVGNVLCLTGYFLEQILWGHQMVAQAVAHMSNRLIEHA